MAVVINELEVAPQPEAQAPAAAPQQGQSGGGAAQQDPVKQVQKILHLKYRRNHRLEAY